VDTAQLTTDGAKNFPLRVRGDAAVGAVWAAVVTPSLPTPTPAKSSHRRRRGASRRPPQIVVADGGVKLVPSDFNPELIVRLLAKLDWAALRQTAGDLGVADLPPAPPADPAADPAFLKAVHDLVMDVHVTEGNLVCPHCARAYPIANGIPNMLLNDDEL
jgi:multifunctional methyltransferase subunit TRM112